MPRRQRNSFAKIITAVFAVGFVASLISTYVAVAAANLFKIQNAELSDLSATATGAIASFDEANIVSDVTFHTLGDSAKYTVTLKNTDEKDHIIESITDDNENPYINYVYDSHAGEQINADSELSFVVTAKYANAVTDLNERAAASNVKFYIKYTNIEEPAPEPEPDPEPEPEPEPKPEPEPEPEPQPEPEEEAPAVPDTGASTKFSDNVHFSMVALIISATGLIIIGIVTLKKHKKASKFIIAAIVTVSAVAAAATVKAATVEVNSFTLTTNYALKDRLVVTWTDTNGNEHEEVVNYNEPANISDPQKEGHTFTGWVDEDGNPVDPSEPIVDDIKIFPTFRANTYTIRFNANGGDGTMADLAMTFGEPKNLPANAFTWDGRTYTGWDTEANGSGAHYGDEAEVKNLTTENNGVVTLYAQWSINPFHIDYDGNGATSGEMVTTNCEYDETCILRNNAFTKTGYDFAGWEYNGTNYANKADVKNIITSDTITMVAQWTVHVYSIEYTGLTTEEAATLRAQGNPDEYTIETSAFTLIKPADRKDADGDVRQHCIGWRDITVYTDITLPIANALGDKKYEAVWEDVALPEYNITYDYDGGDVTTANPAKHNKEQSFTLNEPVKEGYTFLGWTGTTIEGNTPVKPYTLPAPHVRSDIEFTAHFRKNGYQVAFNINTDDTHVSGNMANMTGLEYDTDYNLTANAFTRVGYTFAGWNTQADGQGTDYTDAQPFRNLTAEDGATVTLYAKWNPIHYTIVFHENSDGVTGDMANQVFTYDEEKKLTQNAFVKDHYKFMGWTTVANGTGTKYDDQASIINLASVDGTTIDLYAQWKERTAYLKGTVNNSWGSAGDMIRSLPGYANATAFRHYEGEPNFDEIGTKYNMAISSSNFPVYTWIDGETIYWWSEAETIYAHEDSRNFFSGLKKAETIDYSGFNFSLTKNLAGFFRNTAALSTIDLSPLAAANPTTLEEIFYGSGIASVDLSPLNTTQTINMKGMFDSTTALETVNLSAIDTTNVTDMSYLFNNSTNLKSVDFSHNNLSSVENMSNMFRADKKLESLNFTGVNTPNLKKMSWMFGGAKIASLDLSDLDTGNVTHFDELFYSADVANLDISGFDTHNATTFGSMFTAFNAHGQVLDLSHFDTASLNYSMYEMFNGTNASVIDLSSFDISAERAANIGMANILNISKNVETIYATEKLHFHDYSSVPDTNLGVPMDYGGQSKLVGGAGSTLPQLTLLGLSEYDKARIDDPCNGKPGMFAVKNAQYICYNANIPSGETGAGAQAGEYLTAGTNRLKDDVFTRQGYTLLGWSTTPGGEIVYADGAEIETEFSKDPIKLYAHWEPMDVTITFHSNFDGVNDTMAQQTITVGEQNNLDANQYSVDHYRFLGWTTEPQGKVMGNESTAIDYADQASTAGFVGDTDLYAKWLYRCRTFATDSWDTIVTNLESDSTYYDATDVCEKEIQMDLDDDSVKETYGLRLINTSTPEECSTPGFSQTACGTVIEFTNYVGIWQWNSTNSTNGGWANATLATRLNGEDLYGKMPEELRSVIIPTYPIVSGANQNGVSPDITASDTNKNKIYLHTGKELGAPNSAFDDKEDLTRTYDFYGVSEHKPYLNRAGGGSWSYDWWLRSALLSRDNIPLGIKSDVGHMISATPGANNKVATYPAFRIGRKLTVSFNAGEGAASETAREYAVSAMNYGTLPTVTTAPEGKIFAGWYTAAEGGDRVNDNDTFVSSNAHTLYAHWITPTFYNITEMQQMTADICATATTPNTNASQFDTTGENVGNKSYIPRRELIDNRDGKSYQVTKLADGKCWMTENLALGDPDSTMTLTPNDSDVSSNFTLPKSDINAFAGSSDVSAVYVDDTFGGYYSVKTANLDFTEYGKSICPKGWRLPSAYNTGDWSKLEQGYSIENGTSSIGALYDEPFNYTHSFYVSNRRISSYYETVYVGPATGSSSFSNFGVYMPDNYTGTTGISGSEGGSIRCVAR